MSLGDGQGGRQAVALGEEGAQGVFQAGPQARAWRVARLYPQEQEHLIRHQQTRSVALL